jgi:hypothetical protein
MYDGWVSATSRVEGDMKNECSQVQELECRLPSVQHSDPMMLVFRWLGSTLEGPWDYSQVGRFCDQARWLGRTKSLAR